MLRRLKRKGSEGPGVNDRFSRRSSSQSLFRSSSGGSLVPCGIGFRKDSTGTFSALPGGGGRRSSLGGGGDGEGGNKVFFGFKPHGSGNSPEHPTHHFSHSPSTNGAGHPRLAKMRSTGNTAASRVLSSRSSINSRDSSESFFHHHSHRGASTDGGGDGDSWNASLGGGRGAPPLSMNYNCIRIEGEVSDEDFTKSADVLAQIITARQSYKTLDKGEEEEIFTEAILARIKQAEPLVELAFDLSVDHSGMSPVGMSGPQASPLGTWGSPSTSTTATDTPVQYKKRGGSGAVGSNTVEGAAAAQGDIGVGDGDTPSPHTAPSPPPPSGSPAGEDWSYSSILATSTTGASIAEDPTLARGRHGSPGRGKKSVGSAEAGNGLSGAGEDTHTGASTEHVSSSSVPASSYLTFVDGLFSFQDRKSVPISWEKFVGDMRAVYSAIENGPCLSVARMRLTTVARKFELYSLLNYEHENTYAEYIKGGVYANGCKIDNALRLECSFAAPTFLEYIVATLKQYPKVPLYKDPKTNQLVTLREFLDEGDVQDPTEMTIDGLGLQPRGFGKKNVSANKVMLEEEHNPAGKFGATLVQCFLSMRGPSNGDLFGGLIRAELEQMEYKEQQILCTERLIPLYGHHKNEVYEVASWIRHQGFHKYERNRWVLSLGTHLPKARVNALPIQAKTAEDQLFNLFHPLFMASLYPEHPEWRDVAALLEHTNAISVATAQRSRSKNLSSRAIPPSSVKLINNPNEYYFFYYYWANFCSLNALRRALELNTFHFTSSVYERPPAFDQLVCGYLLSDVVYHHGLSLQKSWVMQYVYMMSRVGVVLSPLCDNLMGVPYFEHPVGQFFRQGMQVSLSTSSPLHCHHRVEQPLIEEYATLMKLCSLTHQDIAEIARNSVLNSNFPVEWKQEWIGGDSYYASYANSSFSSPSMAAGRMHDRRDSSFSIGSFSATSPSAGALGSQTSSPAAFHLSVCPYRLQFRQETIIHEITLLHLVCKKSASSKGRQSTLPLFYPLVSAAEGGVRLPDVALQYRSSKRLHYIDKRVIFPRISIQLAQLPSQTVLTDASEVIRQVVMLRKKYIHSYATDVKVEDVFSRAHSFNEKKHEYNNYYGVFVLSKIGHAPSWPSFIPPIAEFSKDMNTVMRAVSSLTLQRLCRHRLHLLERKFLLHLSMNITNEAGKREKKEWNNRDFFTAHKVDNNIVADAGLNARTLLEYFVDKVVHHGEDVVREENSIPVTLRELVSRYNINMSCITVDELNYQMTAHPDLWALFLSPDNYMQGRYFAELTKEKLKSDMEDASCYAENRLRIYGNSPDEWYMLAHWFDRYGMASSHNRWMIALPRNYPELHQKGAVKSLGDFLEHLFSPLWDISLHPAKDTKFHYFLTHVSGFDCIDEESNMDKPMNQTYPHDWKTRDKPSFTTYLYYYWANIASLNKFRASRGLGTFTFRPQCGEFGHRNHLIAGFLLANSINHGVTLVKHPALEYLYYITQLGVAMSPLSNTAGASPYLSNPFPQFFHCGLNVSLATNQPIHFHFTREPLIEEYSIAAKMWKFEFNDLSEIARNSVRQSGFPHSWKENALGKRYFLHSTLGNDVRRSRLSDIRIAFRFETYHSELDFLDAQLLASVIQKVPRAMLTLTEERRLVAEAPDHALEKETKMALEKYLSGLRRHLRRKSAQARAAASNSSFSHGRSKSGLLSSSSRSTTSFGRGSSVHRDRKPSSVSLDVEGDRGSEEEEEDERERPRGSTPDPQGGKRGAKGNTPTVPVLSSSAVAAKVGSEESDSPGGGGGGGGVASTPTLLTMGTGSEEAGFDESTTSTMDGGIGPIQRKSTHRFFVREKVDPNAGEEKSAAVGVEPEERKREWKETDPDDTSEGREGAKPHDGRDFSSPSPTSFATSGTLRGTEREEEKHTRNANERDGENTSSGGDGRGSSPMAMRPTTMAGKAGTSPTIGGGASSSPITGVGNRLEGSPLPSSVLEEAKSNVDVEPGWEHSPTSASFYSTSLSPSLFLGNSLEGSHPSRPKIHAEGHTDGDADEVGNRGTAEEEEEEVEERRKGGAAHRGEKTDGDDNDDQTTPSATGRRPQSKRGSRRKKKKTKKTTKKGHQGLENGEDDATEDDKRSFRDDIDDDDDKRDGEEEEVEEDMPPFLRSGTEPAILAAANAAMNAAAASLRTTDEAVSASTEDASEENRVMLEGALSRGELLTTKKFLQHDISSLQHRIEEIRTCLLLLAESNNQLAEEAIVLMNRRLEKEKKELSVRIEGQLEHKEGDGPARFTKKKNEENVREEEEEEETEDDEEEEEESENENGEGRRD